MKSGGKSTGNEKSRAVTEERNKQNSPPMEVMPSGYRQWYGTEVPLTVIASDIAN
jgi:hypothetical protein